MTYTEINAQRVLARKLYEAGVRPPHHSVTWHHLSADMRREYERDVEKLFDLKDEETRDALLVLLHDSA
jgi:hypothetical protein